MQAPKMFGQQFIDEYLKNGFQSLSKKDMDLLIYYLLENGGAIKKSDSNYNVAKELRISKGKVLSIRRDAYARWGILNDKDLKEKVSDMYKHVFSEDAIEEGLKYVSGANKENGYIAFRLEHPADKELLEQEILKVGSIPKKDFNGEVLIVQFSALLKIAEIYKIFNPGDDRLKNNILREIRKHAELKDVLKKDIKDITAEDLRDVLNDVVSIRLTRAIKDFSLSSLLKLVFGV